MNKTVLSKAFRLTTPIYIHEYDSVSNCEYYLRKSRDLDFIGVANVI